MASPYDEEESESWRPAYPERPGRWPDRHPDRWPDSRWPESPRPGRKRRDPFPFAKIVEIGGPVGYGGANNRADVIKTQIMLGNSGHYDLAGLGAPTGWPGGELVRAIRKYQKQKGLTPDGLLLPLDPEGIGADGTGETLAALREDVGPRLAGYAAPTPEEVDRYYEGRGRLRDRIDEDEEEDEVGLPEIIVAETGNQAGHPLGVLRPSLQTLPNPGAISPPAAAPGSKTAAITGALNAAPTIVNLLRMAIGAVTGGEAPSGEASGSDATGSQAPNPQANGPAGQDQASAPNPPPQAGLPSDTGPVALPAPPRGLVLSDEPPLQPLQAKPGEQLAYMSRRDDLLNGKGRMLPEGGWIPGAGGPRGAAPQPKPQTAPPGPTQRMPSPGQNPLETDSPRWNAPAPPGGLFRPVGNAASQHPTDHDQARTPDPAQPEEDKRQADAVPPAPERGRIIIAEDGRELHVPPLGAWADELDDDDRKIADALSDAFAIEMAKRPGSRGHEWTQKGVDIYIQECLKSANEDFPELKGNVRHVAGGTRDGEGDRPVKEEYLANVIDGLKARLGSGRTDFVLEFARNTVQRWRADTMSTDSGGNHTADEVRRKENHQRLTEGERVAGFNKFSEGVSESDMRKEARAQCRDELAKWVEDLRKTGEFDKPKPETPAGGYTGHSILRKLRK